MNWMLAAGILSVFAIAGAIIRLIAAGWRGSSSKPPPEPENSHPGRVLPPGVCIGHALRKKTGERYEPPTPLVLAARMQLHKLSSMIAHPASPPPRTALFREGQWLRQGPDGALVRYIFPSAKPGYSWVWVPGPSVKSPDAFLNADEDLIVALPRKGEWWQKAVCSSNHSDAQDGSAWLDAPVKWSYNSGEMTAETAGMSKLGWEARFENEEMACACGCLAPVNFGCGPAAAVPPPSEGRINVSSCWSCGEIVAVVARGDVIIAAHCHIDGSMHRTRMTTRALPKASERWRFDNCPVQHLHPQDLADLTKSGEFSYDEGGTLFTVKADWSSGIGVAACLECGCLRRTTDDQSGAALES